MNTYIDVTHLINTDEAFQTQCGVDIRRQSAFSAGTHLLWFGEVHSLGSKTLSKDISYDVTVYDALGQSTLTSGRVRAYSFYKFYTMHVFVAFDGMRDRQLIDASQVARVHIHARV